MEKKVTKKFYLLSLINVVAILIMTGAHLQDSFALLGVLIVLIFNHTTLLNMVSNLTKTMTLTGDDAKQAMRKVLFFLVLKMTLLVSVMVMIYFYDKSLTPKALLLMIFQLIIQVVSIKNNY